MFFLFMENTRNKLSGNVKWGFEIKKIERKIKSDNLWVLPPQASLTGCLVIFARLAVINRVRR